MIASFFILLGYYIALAILSVCPTGTGFPSIFHSAATYLGSFNTVWSPILPFSVLRFCLDRLIELVAILLVIALIRFMLKHIPFLNIG